MKNHFIILALLLVSFAYGYNTVYVENIQRYPHYGIPYNNGLIYNPCYNSIYNPYFRPYDQIKINRLNNIPHYKTRVRRLEKKRYKNIGFFNRGNGSITGYSMPINHDDIYKQMGISPYNPKAKQKYNSINCNQELFSTPSGDEMHYNNGKYYKDLKGASGKTGVTIIYD